MIGGRGALIPVLSLLLGAAVEPAIAIGFPDAYYWQSGVAGRFATVGALCSAHVSAYGLQPSNCINSDESTAGYSIDCTLCGQRPHYYTALQGYSAKNLGSPSCNARTPNPINASTGNKYWSDTDYESPTISHLLFRRQYNSQWSAGGPLGTAWRHNFAGYVTTGSTATPVTIARADGATYTFVLNGSGYISQDPDVTDRLVRIVDSNGNTSEWKFTVASDDSLESYDAAGKLISIQDRFGRIHALAYSDTSTPPTVAPKAGLLIRVSDAFGRQLNFAYDNSSRIIKMVDPVGGEYVYSYSSNNILKSVTYPGSKTKTYHSNEATYNGGNTLPNTLTGITDENGVRYASYYYNARGKAIASELAGGLNRYQLSYSSDGGSTTITDPLKTTRTTTFTAIQGVLKTTGQSQPGGAGCGSASSAITYDANGNIASRSDFNGVQTTYAYDLARNLETSRTEAAGTAQARTITTEWHSTYGLPTRIAEPKRITTNTYDASGNLLSKTVQATSDATGAQGFGATAVGTPRSRSYTYNAVCQVLTATGPRTDEADVTTYAYGSQGNLVTITNAANQVTTLSNYDAHGRAGRIVDPNGLVTELAYSPRGWLTSKTVGGEATSYEYDGVGQLKKVTLPDASVINYTYDDAHRLTTIADRLGNRIVYTLDAMGNRISEQVSDSNGVLARQGSRIFDALNRLEAVSGGTQ